MYAEAKFCLEEKLVFSGSFSWRLKGNHIRFRGTNGEGVPMAPRQPVPARNIWLDQFVAALDFLDVWNWKPDYDPTECGVTVCDGKSWSFSASIAGKECKTGGYNAFPSFEDVQKTSLKEERYGFLVMAIKSAFEIDEFTKQNF